MAKILGDDWNNDFALIEWNPKWNKTEVMSCINPDFKEGNVVFLVTVMGGIWFDLADGESIEAFGEQMEHAILTLREARKEWVKKKDVNSQNC